MPTTNGKNKTNKKHRNNKKNDKRKNHKTSQIRSLTDTEKKRLITGSAPNPVKTIVNVTKKPVKAHTDLHKKREGVLNASKSTKPWAMKSMKYFIIFAVMNWQQTTTYIGEIKCIQTSTYLFKQ